MIRPRRKNPVVLALWANAILLAGILIAMLARGGMPSFTHAAFADQVPPIAGGGGVFIMPAQLSRDIWGCYLIDVDRQNLVVYDYQPGVNKLKLVAARSYKYDRNLHDLSTEPSTEDVRRIWEREQNMRKGDENPQPQNPEKQKE
jgi:hypothetical protein